MPDLETEENAAKRITNYYDYLDYLDDYNSMENNMDNFDEKLKHE